MSKIKVRAHHGLCIRFFARRGYSETFTKNMARVITLLESNPMVEISDEPDLICAQCPKRGEDDCRDWLKVHVYDQKVLDLCGLRRGATMSWQEYQKQITEKIMSAGQFDALCGDCSWASICHCVQGKTQNAE